MVRAKNDFRILEFCWFAHHLLSLKMITNQLKPLLKTWVSTYLFKLLFKATASTHVELPFRSMAKVSADQSVIDTNPRWPYAHCGSSCFKDYKYWLDPSPSAEFYFPFPAKPFIMKVVVHAIIVTHALATPWRDDCVNKSGNMNTEDLLRQLDEQHRAYLETFKAVHEALSQSLVNRSPSSPGLAPTSAPRQRRRSTIDADGIDLPLITIRSISKQATSFTTGETDISDDDDALYVQDLLPSYKFDFEDLKDHLKRYVFNEEGHTLLKTVVDGNGRLKSPELFPKSLDEASSHNSHYSIFDVGTDGTPLSRHKYVSTGSTIDSAIWQAIQVSHDTFALNSPTCS